MKVKELIERLGQEDPEVDVRLCYDYGDHKGTLVVIEVCAVEETEVRHSPYHGMDALVDETRRQEGDSKRVVVLS